jgi:hypothetical protein
MAIPLRSIATGEGYVGISQLVFQYNKINFGKNTQTLIKSE